MIIAFTVYAASLLLGVFIAQVIADRIETNPHFR
jgi:hypothetical protein